MCVTYSVLLLHLPSLRDSAAKPTRCRSGTSQAPPRSARPQRAQGHFLKTDDRSVVQPCFRSVRTRWLFVRLHTPGSFSPPIPVSRARLLALDEAQHTFGAPQKAHVERKDVLPASVERYLNFCCCDASPTSLFNRVYSLRLPFARERLQATLACPPGPGWDTLRGSRAPQKAPLVRRTM